MVTYEPFVWLLDVFGFPCPNTYPPGSGGVGVGGGGSVGGGGGSVGGGASVAVACGGGGGGGGGGASDVDVASITAVAVAVGRGVKVSEGGMRVFVAVGVGVKVAVGVGVSLGVAVGVFVGVFVGVGMKVGVAPAAGRAGAAKARAVSMLPSTLNVGVISEVSGVIIASSVSWPTERSSSSESASLTTGDEVAPGLTIKRITTKKAADASAYGHHQGPVRRFLPGPTARPVSILAIS